MYHIVKTRETEDAVILVSTIKRLFKASFHNEYFSLDVCEYDRFNALFWSGCCDVVEDVKADDLTLDNRDDYTRRYFINHKEFNLTCNYTEYNGDIITKRRAQYLKRIEVIEDDYSEDDDDDLSTELVDVISPDTQFTKEQLVKIVTSLDENIPVGQTFIYHLNNKLSKLDKAVVPTTYKVSDFDASVSGYKERYYYKLYEYTGSRGSLKDEIQYNESV